MGDKTKNMKAPILDGSCCVLCCLVFAGYGLAFGGRGEIQTVLSFRLFQRASGARSLSRIDNELIERTVQSCDNAFLP